MMKTLPTVIKLPVILAGKTIVGGTKVIVLGATQITKHIFKFGAVVIENVPHKKDYAEDLTILRAMGMPIKAAANLLGISVSYAYRLLNGNKD